MMTALRRLAGNVSAPLIWVLLAVGSSSGAAPAQFWRQMASSTPLSWTAMTYDTARSRAVLFGGYVSLGNQFLGDTWEWNGSDWSLVSSSGPVGRRDHALAFDSVRDRVVLFGGGDMFIGPRNDTWEWDGIAWTQVATTGPSPRIRHAMAYDRQRGCTVLYGGSSSPSTLGPGRPGTSRARRTSCRPSSTQATPCSATSSSSPSAMRGRMPSRR